MAWYFIFYSGIEPIVMIKLMTMKKIICLLGMASILTMGTVTTSDAQYRYETKKGWSKKKKGAVIGAGAGAVSGALLNREHRAGGAVVGGAVGAGVGYLIGKRADKRNPSTTYKTKRVYR